MKHQAHESPSTEQITYRKSSYSGQNGHCVEVADAAGGLWLRDSKNPTVTSHFVTAHQWNAFISRVKTGEFDS